MESIQCVAYRLDDQGLLVQFLEGEDFSSSQIFIVALQHTQPLSPTLLCLLPRLGIHEAVSPLSATPSWHAQGQLPFATSRGRDRESDD